ncbi:protein gvpI [Halorubrum sp. RMP-47]|uniref:Protein gvpI n=1 Tax=Halorubrum miltondacostae TaxID=3076378 RepID=A0ABD5M3U0_9EURY
MNDNQSTHDRKARQAQTKAQINRNEARQKLLRQRKKLAKRRKANREQSEERRESMKSQENPTAYSTMPPQKSNAQNAVRNSHSTVPETPKYSTIVASDRLYGQRLHRVTTDSMSTSTETTESQSDDISQRQDDVTPESTDE